MNGLYFDRDGKEITVRQFGFLSQIDDYHKIAAQNFEGGIWVSTVWLGINHNFSTDGPPLIFETMIFSKNDGYPYDTATMRYATEPEAIAGHQRVCDDIEHGRRPWFLGEE